MIGRKDGRQYDNVAAMKVGQRLRGQIIAAHQSIHTYEPTEEGVDAATHAGNEAAAAHKRLDDYFAVPHIEERRGGVVDQRSTTSEELAERLASAVAKEGAEK